MRRVVRLILLCISPALLACAALAQPARRPESDARCKAAAHKFIAAVSDKKHRTVESQSWVEYDEGRQYLRLCGDHDDNFTRSVRESVESHEAARRCEAETWPRYSARVTVNYTDAPERRREAYGAAREYLRLCGRYDTQGARYAARQAERYESALSPPSANAPPAPCDAEAKAGLYEHFLRNYKGSALQQSEAFVTAKEYLCRCADDDAVTQFIKTWLLKYENRHDYGPVARPEEKRDAGPRCRCDEMRDEMLGLSKEGMSGYGDGHGKNIYETAKKFLRVCGGKDYRFDAFIRSWVEKYDKAVREFEEGRKAAEGPSKEQPE